MWKILASFLFVMYIMFLINLIKLNCLPYTSFSYFYLTKTLFLYYAKGQMSVPLVLKEQFTPKYKFTEVHMTCAQVFLSHMMLYVKNRLKSAVKYLPVGLSSQISFMWPITEKHNRQWDLQQRRLTVNKNVNVSLFSDFTLSESKSSDTLLNSFGFHGTKKTIEV